MERFDREIRENYNKNQQESKKKNRLKNIKEEKTQMQTPSYDIYGNTTIKIEKKKTLETKKIIIPTAIIFIVLGVIYLPQILHKENLNSGGFLNAPDSTAIKLASQYVLDCPDDDYDGDGLINCKEEEYGCSPFLKDSDKDGVSDYAEITLYQTSPVKTNSTLMNHIREQDSKEGKTINTPYKMGNVILWADSYNDKVFGGVIETFGGYRFHDFNGWAQFGEKAYAYKYINGKHILLQHKEKENAWKIDEDMVVMVYDKELDMINRFTVFGKSFYVNSNVVSDIIEKLLPNDAGFFMAEKIAKIDADPEMREDVIADFEVPEFDVNDLSRFGLASDSLHAIINVREMLDNNKTVAVSLFSTTRGENIGVVYGYTPDGRLLVCDTDGNTLGYISIIEKAGYMLNEKDEIVTRQWFAFEGLGYSSSFGDRLSFFESSDGDKSQVEEEKGQGENEIIHENTNEDVTIVVPEEGTEPLPDDNLDTPAGETSENADAVTEITNE